MIRRVVFELHMIALMIAIPVLMPVIVLLSMLQVARARLRERQ
jgi:hypothetical protein